MNNPATHHDALEFPDGQVVLVTRLCRVIGYFWLLLFNGRCFVYEISLSGMAKVAITCRAIAARLYFWLLLFNGRCFVYEIFSREWLK